MWQLTFEIEFIFNLYFLGKKCYASPPPPSNKYSFKRCLISLVKQPTLPELLEPLGEVEEFLEVGPNGIVGQVQPEQGAEAHEHIVGQDGEAVVGQRQGHEAQRGRQHGGVNVLDMVAGQVEVAQ